MEERPHRCRGEGRDGDPWNAIAVANAFLALAKKDGEPITAMKLQKLCYFAHGYHLAIYGTPLIDEPLQAWQYGPVVPTIYHAFKKFGGAIDSLGKDFDEDGARYVPKIDSRAVEDLQLIEKVWKEFGDYSAMQLSNMTHEADTPWSKVLSMNSSRLRFVNIPNAMIKRYFRTKLEANRERITA